MALHAEAADDRLDDAFLRIGIAEQTAGIGHADVAVRQREVEAGTIEDAGRRTATGRVPDRNPCLVARAVRLPGFEKAPSIRARPLGPVRGLGDDDA